MPAKNAFKILGSLETFFQEGFKRDAGTEPLPDKPILEKATIKLVKQMIKRDSQFVTVIYGEDVTDAQAAAVEEQLNAKFGSKVEITFVNGGQPVYYYIISVE